MFFCSLAAHVAAVIFVYPVDLVDCARLISSPSLILVTSLADCGSTVNIMYLDINKAFDNIS